MRATPILNATFVIAPKNSKILRSFSDRQSNCITLTKVVFLMTNKRRRVRKFVLALMALILVTLVGFPYLPGFLSHFRCPVDTVSFTDAQLRMRVLARAIHAYSMANEGSLPKSADKLLFYAKTLSSDTQLACEGSGLGDFQYFPDAPPGTPVACCYLPYSSGRNTLIWIDRYGNVYCARVWLGPSRAQ